MKKLPFFILLAGLCGTLNAQKITLEPGMGLGFGILTSGGSSADNNAGTMGLELHSAVSYPIASNVAKLI